MKISRVALWRARHMLRCIRAVSLPLALSRSLTGRSRVTLMRNKLAASHVARLAERSERSRRLVARVSRRVLQPRGKKVTGDSIPLSSSLYRRRRSFYRSLVSERRRLGSPLNCETHL